MVPNCPWCQIVRGAKLSAVPNCPLLHYGAKLSWCQIVRGAKLSAVPNCPWCQIVHFYTMVPNCPPTWAVPNCPWCQIVLVPNCPRTLQFVWCEVGQFLREKWDLLIHTRFFWMFFFSVKWYFDFKVTIPITCIPIASTGIFSTGFVLCSARNLSQLFYII